ncbi:hypothetical protein [Bradyrhizobium sp. LMG 9283]|uniref:hypothetical protein n=1 Tax=Bradyrhizobium sp. LMG 9283 TaxID=592064 RepID=UPI0038910BF0
MKEYIYQPPDDVQEWECICGNTTCRAGFTSCDGSGNEMRPTLDSEWQELYLCLNCGRTIDQNTLEVVGRNPNPILL